MSLIKLMSNDGATFSVDTGIVNQFATIKTMLDDLGGGDDNDELIPLPNIGAAILEKIILWASHHKNDDNVEGGTDDDISEWDSEFLKVDQKTLFGLILAANYLDIQPLLETTCKTVANLIRGKTPEQIQDTFNIDPISQAEETPKGNPRGGEKRERKQRKQ